MSIQIVGKMVNGNPMIFSRPIDKPVEVDDVLKNEDGEYLRVIFDRQRLSSVVIDVPSIDENDYQDTIDSFLMDTGRM
ncbi:MAG: hypothetical protein H6961_10385 [Chromatiaceae bacterium]|nr:hypothetical protein [Chromatiaceae bacterium]